MKTQNIIDGQIALLFSRVADDVSAVKLHDAGCPFVEKAARTGKQEIVTEHVAEEVADLIERGFKITVCKCAKSQLQ